jgi:hypothetical protein
MSGSERVYKSPTKEWDIFISHASEDKPYVRVATDSLEESGFSVFIDERDLIIGRSLRGQIDHALINSRFGVLFLSPSFMAKRWPREEFDALFTLEEEGQTKILPIMLNTDVEAVKLFSPILATRLALPASANPAVTACDIATHIERIYVQEGSWAQLVRVDALCLPWVQRPLFLLKSLKMLDDFCPHFWIPWKSETELPTFHDAPTLLLGQLISQAICYDGQCVIVTGRQERLQFYRRQGNDFVEYVFQLRTRDPAYRNSIIYVRHVAVEEGNGALPNEQSNDLTVVIGVVIASGAMTLSDGSINSCLYMVAAKVFHIPEIQ